MAGSSASRAARTFASVKKEAVRREEAVHAVEARRVRRRHDERSLAGNDLAEGLSDASFRGFAADEGAGSFARGGIGTEPQATRVARARKVAGCRMERWYPGARAVLGPHVVVLVRTFPLTRAPIHRTARGMRREERFEDAQGNWLACREPAPGVVHFVASGRLTVELAQHLTDFSDGRGAARLSSFLDWWAVESYASKARYALTRWSVANRQAFACAHVLTRSRLVRMGVSVANISVSGIGVLHDRPRPSPPPSRRRSAPRWRADARRSTAASPPARGRRGSERRPPQRKSASSPRKSPRSAGRRRAR